MDVEQLAKEFDRQVGKKQRLEDELAAIAQELHTLSLRIGAVLKESKDPWK